MLIKILTEASKINTFLKKSLYFKTSVCSVSLRSTWCVASLRCSVQSGLLL